MAKREVYREVSFPDLFVAGDACVFDKNTRFFKRGTPCDVVRTKNMAHEGAKQRAASGRTEHQNWDVVTDDHGGYRSSSILTVVATGWCTDETLPASSDFAFAWTAVDRELASMRYFLPRACDGITLLTFDLDGSDLQNAHVNTFTLEDLDATVPEDCYEHLNDPDMDEWKTMLCFLVSESYVGSVMNVLKPDPNMWSRIQLHPPRGTSNEDYMDGNISSEEDGLIKHLKYLSANGAPSATPPNCPLFINLYL
jgi:hypothetical protein